MGVPSPASPADSLLKRTAAVVRPAGPDGRVLLTFDDGPDPAVTPRVLDLLDGFGVRAIFFVVGNRIPKAPHLLAEAVRRGHEIGNHSFAHTTGLPYARRASDMVGCTRELERLSGVRPRFYRPPEGKLDMATVLASLRHRHRLMLWSIDSGDWQARSPEIAAEKAEALSARLAAQPTRREILLFHDYSPHTPVMLERILPELERAGRLIGSPRS